MVTEIIKFALNLNINQPCPQRHFEREFHLRPIMKGNAGDEVDHKLALNASVSDIFKNEGLTFNSFFITEP